jgi:hypothetical protein
MLKRTAIVFFIIAAIAAGTIFLRATGSNNPLGGLAIWAGAAAALWAVVVVLAAIDEWELPKKAAIAGVIGCAVAAAGLIIYEIVKEATNTEADNTASRILVIALVVTLAVLGAAFADEAKGPEYIEGRHRQ